MINKPRADTSGRGLLYRTTEVFDLLKYYQHIYFYYLLINVYLLPLYSVRRQTNLDFWL